MIMDQAVVKPYRGKLPTFGEGCFVASCACLTGDIECEEGVNIWFNVSMRGDVNHIRIGARTNIQDNAVIHVTHNGNPTIIGKDVTIGHGAILHACTVEDFSLIGMGATVLDGAVIPKMSLVGAGSLVSPGKTFPEGHLIVGSPAVAKRPLNKKEMEYLPWSAKHYVKLADEYAAEYKRG